MLLVCGVFSSWYEYLNKSIFKITDLKMNFYLLNVSDLLSSLHFGAA